MPAMKHGESPEEKAVMVFAADDGQLSRAISFVNEALDCHDAPKPVYGQLGIAVEELFVNVCHYAYPEASPDAPGEVRISCEFSPSPATLIVTIADDGIPYDPLAKPDPTTPDDVMEVPIGGLGIFMAKQSVDDFSYERVGNSNVVTLVKRW